MQERDAEKPLKKKEKYLNTVTKISLKLLDVPYKLLNLVPHGLLGQKKFKRFSAFVRHSKKGVFNNGQVVHTCNHNRFFFTMPFVMTRLKVAVLMLLRNFVCSQVIG